MKWQLVLMACLLLGCVASVGAWSDNMNNGERVYTCMAGSSPSEYCYAGGGNFGGDTSAYSDTYGYGTGGLPVAVVSPSTGSPTTYFAGTATGYWGDYHTFVGYYTYDSSKNLISGKFLNSLPLGGGTHRMEVVIAGTTIYTYWDGVLSDTNLNQPLTSIYYFGVDYSFLFIDDYSSDMLYTDTSLISAPPHTFVINRDLLSTVTREYNAAGGVANNSYLNLQFSIGPYADGWSISNPPNSRYHVIVTSPSGKQTSDTYINFSQYGSACGIIPISFNSSYVDNSPLEYGVYAVYLRDATTGSVRSSDYFTVTAALGSIVSWGKGSYGNGETATISYSIPTAYYDTTAYTYNIEVVSIYGTVIGTQPISSQTGSVSIPLNGATPGVYYAELNAVPVSTTTNYMLAQSATEVSAYVTFNGYVMNEETADTLSGANITVSQGTNALSQFSASTGAWNSSNNWLTGTPITVTTNLSGYTDNVRILTPLASGEIPFNISMVPTTHTYTGVAIGGIVRDNQYGNPVTSATVNVYNTSTSESYNNVTNIAGYYLVNNLVGNRLYNVSSTKSGYSNSTIAQVVAVGV